MFWRRFEKRTAKELEPDDRESRAALRAAISALFLQNPRAQYTLRHIEQKVQSRNLAALSLALAELQQEGTLQRIVRVESPETHGGIAEFASVADLPSEVFDWRTQRTVAVEPSNISFIFRAPALETTKA